MRGAAAAQDGGPGRYVNDVAGLGVDGKGPCQAAVLGLQVNHGGPIQKLDAEGAGAVSEGDGERQAFVGTEAIGIGAIGAGAAVAGGAGAVDLAVGAQEGNAETLQV